MLLVCDSYVEHQNSKRSTCVFCIGKFKIAIILIAVLHLYGYPRVDLVSLPPCGQRRYGPATRSWAESKERKRQEGAETQPGFLPGQAHGGLSQKSCVLVHRPTRCSFRDTQASRTGQKLWEKGGGLVWTFYCSAHPPVSSLLVSWPVFYQRKLTHTKSTCGFRKAVAASVDPPNLVVYVAQDCTSKRFLFLKDLQIVFGSLAT